MGLLARLAFLLTGSEPIVHGLHVALPLLRDGFVLELGGLRGRVVRIVVEGLVCGLHQVAAQGVAGAADALDACLDVFYDLIRHVVRLPDGGNLNLI